MKISIYTNDGNNSTTEIEDYDAEVIVADMEAAEDGLVVIGDAIVPKHTVYRICPDNPRGGIAIHTNDGKISYTEMENYNAKEILQKLKAANNALVAIGDVIVSRSAVYRIVPVPKA